MALSPELDATVELVSKQYRIDPNLTRAIIEQESGGDVNAVSKQITPGKGAGGAKGLMQIYSDAPIKDAQSIGYLPEGFTIKTPEDDIKAGVAYLATLRDKYNAGNVENLLMMYNGSPSLRKLEPDATVEDFKKKANSIVGSDRAANYDFDQPINYRDSVLEKYRKITAQQTAQPPVQPPVQQTQITPQPQQPQPQPQQVVQQPVQQPVPQPQQVAQQPVQPPQQVVQQPVQQPATNQLTFDNFDYKGYINKLTGKPPEEELDDVQKKYTYNYGAKQYYNYFKKELGLKKDDAEKAVLSIMPDAYDVFGLAKPLPQDKQLEAMSLEAFDNWSNDFVKKSPLAEKMTRGELASIYTDKFSKKNGFTLLGDKATAKAVKSKFKAMVDAADGALTVDEYNKQGKAEVDRAIKKEDDSSFFDLFKGTGTAIAGNFTNTLDALTYNKAVENIDKLDTQVFKDIDTSKPIDLTKFGSDTLRGVNKAVKYVTGLSPAGLIAGEGIDIGLDSKKSNDEKVYDVLQTLETLKTPPATHDSALMTDVKIREEINQYNKLDPEQRKAKVAEWETQVRRLQERNKVIKGAADADINITNEDIASTTPKELSFAQNLVRDVVIQLPQQAAQLGIVAGASALGSPVVGVGTGAALLSSQAGVLQKQDALRQGKTLDEANAVGIGTALSEAGTEFIGGKFLEPLVKAGGSKAKEVVKSVISEFGTEGANAIIQEALKSEVGLSDIINNPDLTKNEKAQELAKLAGYQGLVGGATAGVVNTPVALLNRRSPDIKDNKEDDTKEDVVTIRKPVDLSPRKGKGKDTDVVFNLVSPLLAKIEADPLLRQGVDVKSEKDYRDIVDKLVGKENYATLVASLGNKIDKDTIANFNKKLNEIIKNRNIVKFDKQYGQYVTDGSAEQRVAAFILNNTEKQATETVSKNKPNGVIFGADDTKHNVVYEVVEADSLNQSTVKNEQQARDRSTKALQNQVDNIAKNLTPERLRPDKTTTFDSGSPVLTKDDKLVAGNGRVLAIKKAYQDGKKGQEYKQYLIDHANEFGIDGEQISNMDKPVVIRRIVDDVNTEEVAKVSNKSQSASITSLEQAKEDYEAIGGIKESDLDKDGNVKAKSDVFVKLLNNTPKTEQNNLTENDGVTPSIQAVQRIQNATLYGAYGLNQDNQTVLDRLIRTSDEGFTNLKKALVNAAAKVASMNTEIEGNHVPAEYSIINDLNNALTAYFNFRNTKGSQSVEEYIAQQDLLTELSDETKALLPIIDKASRKPSELTAFLNRYADNVMKERTAQNTLFNDAPSVLDMINSTAEQVGATTTVTQQQQTTPKKSNIKTDNEYEENIRVLGKLLSGEKVIKRFNKKTGITKLYQKGKVIHESKGDNTTSYTTDQLLKKVKSVIESKVKNGEQLSVEEHAVAKKEGVLDGTYKEHLYKNNGADIVALPTKNNGDIDVDAIDGATALEKKGKENARFTVGDVEYTVYKSKKPKKGSFTYTVNLKRNGKTERFQRDVTKPEIPVPTRNDLLSDSVRFALGSVAEINIRQAVLNPEQETVDNEENPNAFYDEVDDADIRIDGDKAYIGNIEIEVGDGGIDEAKSVLRMLRFQDASITDSFGLDEEVPETHKYTKTTVERMIASLPERIQNMFIFLDSKDNILVLNDSAGMFDPNFNNEGAKILINMRKPDDVIKRAIAHELRHFVFDSWQPPISLHSGKLVSPIEELYNKLWEDNRNAIIGKTKPYIERYNIDVNKPLLTEKQLLVDEYFANSNTNIFNIKGKGEVAKLSKKARDYFVFDVMGETKESRELAETILDIQDAFSLDRLITIQVNQSDGKVKITPTPYGAILNRDIYDKHKYRDIQNFVKRMTNSKGLKRKLINAYYTYLPFSSPLGNLIPHLISTSGQTASKILNSLLNKPKLIKLRVERELLSVGVDIEDVKGSYVDAFERLNLNSKRQLRHAKQADEWARRVSLESAFYYDNIQSEIRTAKKYLIAAAKRDGSVSDNVISSFLNRLQAYANSIKEDWSHRSYHAYTREGIKDIEEMRYVLESEKGAKEFAEKIKKAKKRLNEINEKENKTSSELKEKIDLERTINIQNRLDALERSIKASIFDERYNGQELAQAADSGLLNLLSNDTVSAEAKSFFDNVLDPDVFYKHNEIVNLARYDAKLAAEVDSILRLYENTVTSEFGAIAKYKLENPDATEEQIKAFTLKVRKQHNKLSQGYVKRKMLTAVHGILTANQSINNGGNGKLALVSANRKIKIDEETLSGQDYIKFLSPVTDKLTKSVIDLEQRASIYNIMRSNNRIFRALLDSGVATIRSSEFSDDNVIPAVSNLQDGSLLKYIDIKEPVRSMLADEIALQSSMENNIASDLVGFQKQVLTAYNPPTAIVNYIGNFPVLFMNGKLFRLFDMAESAKMIPELWRSEIFFTSKKNKTKAMFQELVDNGVLNSNQAAAMLDMAGGDKFVDHIFDFIKNTSIKLGASKASVEILREETRILNSKIRNFYINGDSVPKILSYVTNRNLAFAKYAMKYKKAKGETVEEYKNRVKEAAIEEAATRTRIENTDYSSVALGIRKLLHGSKLRIALGDFVMFNLVMLSIQIQNVKLLRNDIHELSTTDNTKEGKVYRNLLLKDITSRVAGNAVTYAGAYAAGSGIGSILMWSIHATLSALGYGDDEYDDDEYAPYASDDMFKAANELANLDRYGNYVYQALPVRTKDKILYINAKSVNAAYTLMPVFDIADDSALQPIKSFLSNFMSLKRDTIALQDLQIIAALTGNEVKNEEGYLITQDDAIIKAAETIIPFWKAFISPNVVDYKKQEKGLPEEGITEKQEINLLKFTGARTKVVRIPKRIRKIAKNINKNLVKFSEREIIRRTRESDIVVPDEQIRSAVLAELKLDKNLWNRTIKEIDIMRRLGVTDKEMRRVLLKGKISNLGSKRGDGYGVKVIMQGNKSRNYYALAMLNRLKNALKATRKLKPERNYLSREAIDNRLSNTERLIQIYREEMEKSGLNLR